MSIGEVEIKKGRAHFLLVSVASVFLLIATTKTIPLFAWYLGLVALFLAAVMRPLPRQYSVPGILFLLFCLLLLMHALVFSQSYDEKGIFIPVTLILSFLVFSSLPPIGPAFRFSLGVTSLIAYAALILLFSGINLGRAHGIFGTANTFATYVNLFLAPVLAYYLLGGGGRGLYALLLMLFATLLATHSRGGDLGLIASMGLFGVFVGTKVLRSNIQRVLYVVAGFTAISLALDWLPQLGQVWLTGIKSADNEHLTSPVSMYERIRLYDIAWQVIKENFPNGTGAFTFRYHFERLKGEDWFNRHNGFVHNDYLQIAVENGAVIFSIFMLFIAALYFYTLKNRDRARYENRLPLVMAVTGITSMLAHSLVDFPFYGPLFQATLGASVGIVNRQLLEIGEKSFRVPAIANFTPTVISRDFVKHLMAVLIFVWLTLPVLAKGAVDYGLDRLRHNDFQGGVYWHSVARALQPGKFEYYWREGTIWEAVGVTRRDTELVGLADEMYAKTALANPMDVTSLLARVQLARLHSDLLPGRFSRDKMLEWVLRAKKLQPYSDIIHIEYMRTLLFIGRRQEAIEQAKVLLKWYPNSARAKALLVEMQGGK